jgi:hypothetical protein
MKTKHTELPWTIHRLFSGLSIITSNNGDIARLPFNLNNAAMMEANAAFIVRACNSFDDLLEACKAAARYVAIKEEEEGHIFELGGLIRKAIAKATQDQPEQPTTKPPAEATGPQIMHDLIGEALDKARKDYEENKQKDGEDLL